MPKQIAIAGPVTQRERLISIDVLRGVAVLGILMMNIQSFAMVGSTYINPTALGDLHGTNYNVWVVTYVLGDMKFMTLFSILFGAGIAMMADRQKSAGRSPAGLHYRRMVWLLVIGLMHAYLIWFGDILVTYAICGMVGYWMRRLPVWMLLAGGLLSISIGSSTSLTAGLTMPDWPESEVVELRESWTPDQEHIDEELAIYRGSWLTQMPHRAHAALGFQTFLFLFVFGWRAGGLMLIGMALYRMDILSAQRTSGFYLSMAMLALPGLAIIIYGVLQNFAHDWAIEYSFFLGSQFNYWGSLLVALGYIGIVMLVCRAGIMSWLTSHLAAAGQMALTCYLMQSVICTLIFYGHGFGLFGYLDRLEQMGVVVVIWIFQLVFAKWWLGRFRFGPMEWVWRSLSYWQRQPMRRSQVS